jgi:hypothetical protein
LRGEGYDSRRIIVSTPPFFAAGITGRNAASSRRHVMQDAFAMTPQSSFMVVAPIRDGGIDALKAELAKMNLPRYPGMADPKNPIVPFGEFGTLHYARFVILEDETLGDLKLLGLCKPAYPIKLAFFGECDGPANDLLASLVRHPIAAAGLRKIFDYCEGFTGNSDLLGWMQEHERRAAATYVNWIGRTVRQIHEEAELRKTLVDYVDSHAAELESADPQEIRKKLIAQAHSLTLTPPEKTPFGWWLRNLLHFSIIPGALLLPWVIVIAIAFLIPLPKLFPAIVIPFLVLAALVFLWLLRYAPASFAVLVALGLLLVPFLILFLIPLVAAVLVFLWVLRWYEKNEPEIIFKPTPSHDKQLAVIEDHDVTNQYTTLGSVKPGKFRRVIFTIILWITDYGARHVYNRGSLARIQTIHFARWVSLDEKGHMLFASNYDGDRQAYMDDFINKVGWGLNIIFSNVVGYPRTNWLVKDGSKNEMKFKDTNRRHQVATQVWYKAYPGLTAFDLARNARVRQGIARRRMTDAEIREWLSDL